jgi:tetratricopeptide (TPR) repeat protein
VLFGIGTYDYWRSALIKQLWWMPGVEDKRGPAIEMVRIAADSGLFVKQASAYHLVSILCNEKRFSEALAIADKMLARYPRSLLFTWGHAQALYGLGRFHEAEGNFQTILLRVQNEAFQDNYSAVMCHFYLAGSYYAQKQNQRAREELSRMDALGLSDVSRKRLEETFKQAAVLRASLQ